MSGKRSELFSYTQKPLITSTIQQQQRNWLYILRVTFIILRWLHAFLVDRRQRVKIGDKFSDWVSPVMPQGTYTSVRTCSYKDRRPKVAARTALVSRWVHYTDRDHKGTEHQQNAVRHVHYWSSPYHMKINIKKTKQMLYGSITIFLYSFYVRVPTMTAI